MTTDNTAICVLFDLSGSICEGIIDNSEYSLSSSISSVNQLNFKELIGKWDYSWIDELSGSAFYGEDSYRELIFDNISNFNSIRNIIKEGTTPKIYLASLNAIDSFSLSLSRLWETNYSEEINDFLNMVALRYLLSEIDQKSGTVNKVRGLYLRQSDKTLNEYHLMYDYTRPKRLSFSTSAGYSSILSLTKFIDYWLEDRHCIKWFEIEDAIKETLLEYEEWDIPTPSIPDVELMPMPTELEEKFPKYTDIYGNIFVDIETGNPNPYQFQAEMYADLLQKVEMSQLDLENDIRNKDTFIPSPFYKRKPSLAGVADIFYFENREFPVLDFLKKYRAFSQVLSHTAFEWEIKTPFNLAATKSNTNFGKFLSRRLP